ncbi:ubiquinone/menaquinone biosynthesis C-methylase UbiE [Panacagrimonas perspica]|uniref:Ubiquinone/menaquinone biosynthesis C-methylase UbiE n=1 Tax=Panacagrimonas perspica TaxID=381431 RepID=A0A4R7NTC0_9GAMM|nr:class I SAM-dependent methyltransferase [Panacagrimonas perspica]TDU24335.1 ubiquinone/menaquinone biosynthesis C-methylase UbiE [Panacagrimonas perspica]THD04727.1 methyltransferase type 11 [Panacagrimonas perspica]
MNSDDPLSLTSKTSLGAYYESHHVIGKRLGQSFEEGQRGPLLKRWIGTGRRVLDLGGRDGQLTRHFVDGNHVTIGDIDAGAMRLAREALGVDTVEVNLNEALPFADASFDVIVMGEVLEHLPYPHLTLEQVRRVLAPGGQYLGSLPLAYHWKDRWDVFRGKKLWMARDPTHLQFMRYSDLRKLLSTYFEVVEIVPLKGGKKAVRWPDQFARVVAFHARKAAG